MKKKFYSVLTLSLALQTVLTPTYSFAESAEKSAEVYTEDQVFKSIKEHVNEHSTHEEDIEVTTNSYYTLQKHSLYTANDLKQIEYRDYRTSRNGDKEKGNAYYITTSTGAGWIDNNDNSLEVQEIHKLSNQKLIVKEEASIHALPFQSFKEEGKLEPQVITPTEQAGNWFKVQINETANGFMHLLLHLKVQKLHY